MADKRNRVFDELRRRDNLFHNVPMEAYQFVETLDEFELENGSPKALADYCIQLVEGGL